MTQPSFQLTAQEINGIPIVLAVGDTSFLDYKKIVEKREDYGLTGNGGNGLILHSCLAVDPDFGQPLGLLWEKLWHRDKKVSPPLGETPTQKKKRLKKERDDKRKQAFESKESYLHRNSPQSSVSIVLNKVQMDVLIANTPSKQKNAVEYTVDWAIRAIARMGGYLEHRKGTAIGIQVLWRGWLKLETLCLGWLLHQNLKSIY
ncbi:hypothetical protein NIES4075_52620 [Tolypothrix sp. NIES-4075]|uniref:hypothetical protein n=1 Tax=Tolypothrix sp. NIES-4075 TaxID=2005459 RepID=UPI000B697DB7|nr:hypothetical protein [Tolypothrix sp. NIES-4075]GAX44244.1 hypothetical protein NIES4075_52620 [Tolypothrix sp. NIES-4075]